MSTSPADSIKKEIACMPPVLRALLEAELGAGNEIVEVGHSFPAPPMGTFFKLAQPLLSREGKSGGGLDYRSRNSPICSGEITDVDRRYFLIEPAAAGDEIKTAGGREPISVEAPLTSAVEASSPVVRFQKSMMIDHEKWHDGIGYDLDALQAMSDDEQNSVEAMLLDRGIRDWRDVEALACLDTSAARSAINTAANHFDPEVRNAVMRCSREIIPDSMGVDILVRQLESANFFAGLGQALDRVADFHPPPVVEVLFRGVLDRPGDVAVHFAAMLCYIHGKTSEPFDVNQRNFFLRFNTTVRSERVAAFEDLCGKIGLDGAPYLKSFEAASTNLAAANDTDYTVEVDGRGEMLTYRELHRSAHVICTFQGGPCILSRTLSNWYYSLGRRVEKMNARERELVLNRVASYCRKHHRMCKLTFE